jgi:beta-lactamase regulating signal transducer with metallopeptidase domain
MTEYLAQLAISNVFVSLGLAIVAWAIHRTGKWPHASHLLWLLVLAKLVTPPLVSVPVVATPGSFVGDLEILANHPGRGSIATGLPSPDLDDAVIGREDSGAIAATRWASSEAIRHGLILLWGLGSVLVLAWSLVHIRRLNLLLNFSTEAAPSDVQRAAAGIARRLRLKATPMIYTTSARLTPMVWWNGVGARVLIPMHLISGLSADHLRWILAHELGHISRRDHLVRWLEWLACVLFGGTPWSGGPGAICGSTKRSVATLLYLRDLHRSLGATPPLS